MAWPTINNYPLSEEDRRKLPSPQAFGDLSVVASIGLVLSTASLAIGQVNRVLWVPAGFRLWGIHGAISDVDNGGTAFVWDLGDATTQARLIASSTKGQAAANLTVGDMVTGVMGYQFTANTDILMTVTTAPTTPAAGTLTLAFFGQYA